MTQPRKLLLQGRLQGRAGLTRIQPPQALDGFALELLTQRHVILLVHFACLEIKRHIPNGGVQGLFLQQ